MTAPGTLLAVLPMPHTQRFNDGRIQADFAFGFHSARVEIHQSAAPTCPATPAALALFTGQGEFGLRTQRCTAADRDPQARVEVHSAHAGMHRHRRP